MIRYLLQQYQRKSLLLLVGDCVLIACSLAILLLWRHFDDNILLLWNTEKIVVIFVFAIVITLLTYYVMGLYDNLMARRPELLLLFISLASGIVLLVYSTISFFIVLLRPGRILLVIFTIFTAILTFAWRLLFQKYIKIQPQKVLFIGNDKTIHELRHIMTNQFPDDYQVIGHWHEHSHNPSLPNLYDTVQTNKIDLIIYSVHSKILAKVTEPLINLRFKQKNISESHYFYQFLTGKFPIQHLNEFWLLMNSKRELYFPLVGAKLKRAFDIVFSLVLLLLGLPLMILASIAIKLETRGPVFFCQERLGINEVPFRLIKFRTMIHNAEELTGPAWSSENDPRITRVGKILRKSRLDELPQFLNVLKGDMSVIGPRPIRRHFADLLAQEIPFYRLRFLGQPGLTGWAQVNYDYAGSSGGQAEKLQYDLFYLVHQSLWLDLLILLKTIRVMVWGKGT